MKYKQLAFCVFVCVISLTFAKLAEFRKFRLNRDALTYPIHIMPFVSKMKLEYLNEKIFLDRFKNLLINKLIDHHAISSRLRFG